MPCVVELAAPAPAAAAGAAPPAALGAVLTLVPVVMLGVALVEVIALPAVDEASAPRNSSAVVRLLCRASAVAAVALAAPGVDSLCGRVQVVVRVVWST